MTMLSQYRCYLASLLDAIEHYELTKVAHSGSIPMHRQKDIHNLSCIINRFNPDSDMWIYPRDYLQESTVASVENYLNRELCNYLDHNMLTGFVVFGTTLWAHKGRSALRDSLRVHVSASAKDREITWLREQLRRATKDCREKEAEITRLTDKVEAIERSVQTLNECYETLSSSMWINTVQITSQSEGKNENSQLQAAVDRLQAQLKEKDSIIANLRRARYTERSVSPIKFAAAASSSRMSAGGM